MKFKQAYLKKFLAAIVGCFFLTMFVLLDVLNGDIKNEVPLTSRDVLEDREMVKMDDIASKVVERLINKTQQTQIVQQATVKLKEIRQEPILNGANDESNATVAKVIVVEESPKQNVTCQDESFIYNLTELNKETRLIYNMVPKCGSLGVRGILGKSGNKLVQGNYNIGFDYMAPFHHQTEHLVRIVKEDLNGHLFQSRLKYIYHKHLHFIDFSIAGAKTPYYMNVVRDPVEHHISLYYFQRENRKLKMFAPWHLLIENTTDGRRQRLDRSYDDCVRTNDIECSTDEFLFTIIPFFCGQDIHCLKPSRIALEQAKQNVNKYYPLVGYVENLKDFFKLGQVLWPQFFTNAAQLFGSGKFSSHKTNARRRQEPSEEVKLVMKSRLTLEYEFYGWIKQRFHCMYDIYVSGSTQNHTLTIRT